MSCERFFHQCYGPIQIRINGVWHTVQAWGETLGSLIARVDDRVFNVTSPEDFPYKVNCWTRAPIEFEVLRT